MAVVTVERPRDISPAWRQPHMVINRTMAVILVLWVVWPQLNWAVPVPVGLGLAAAWLVTSQTCLDPREWTGDMVGAGLFLLSFLPFAFSGSFSYGGQPGVTVLATFALFLVGIPMSKHFMEGGRDPAFGRTIFAVATLGYAAGAVQTLLGLTENPMAARLLSAAREMTDAFKAQGIGGFGFIYGLTLFIVPIFALSIRRLRCGQLRAGLFYAAVTLLGFVTLFRAAYAIALIGVVAASGLILFSRRVGPFLMASLVSVVSVVLFRREIATAIESRLDDDSVPAALREKLGDVASVMLADELQGQTAGRVDLYAQSLRTFAENPLFGVEGSPWIVEASLVGDHSGWLDLLARYGLWAGLPLAMALFMFIRRILKRLRGDAQLVVLTVFSLFLVLGVLNPNLTNYQIGLTMFLIVPLAIGRGVQDGTPT